MALHGGAGGSSIGGALTGGTNNSVLFVNPAGVIAQDNANFTYVVGTTTFSAPTMTAATNINSPLLTLTGTTPTITSAGAGAMVIGTSVVQNLQFQISGTSRWYLQGATGHFLAVADNNYDIGASGASRPRNLYLASSIKQVGGVLSSGTVGVPVIVSTARATVVTNAAQALTAFTVGAADASFVVSANVLVTTATTHSFTVTCTYTSEDNVSRVITFSFEQLAGTFTTTVVNTNGAVPYEGVPLHIRAKAATTIQIASAAGGTYTNVVYNIEGLITKYA